MHGSFTPLVFSATGGMAPAATVMYKILASLLAEKTPPGLQQNNHLDPNQPQFFAAQIGSDVLERCSL